MDTINSYQHRQTELMELSTLLYQIVLRGQRGMAIQVEDSAKKESLIVEIQSSCNDLILALSATSSSGYAMDEEESREDREQRLEMLSNASGVCSYAQGLIIYCSEGGGPAAVHSQRTQSKAKLKQAVKKAPHLLLSWLLLSHLRWERGDISGAIRSITNGLSFANDQGAELVEENLCEGQEDEDRASPIPMDFPRRVALQQLSMLVRQLKSKDPSSPASLQLSLDLASSAVRGDVADGYSWYCLALAQLSSYLHLHTPLQMDGEGFGTAGRRARLLKQTLASFSQAEGNGCAGLADLFFNRAQILTYRQDFQLAILDYERAASLDKTLPTGSQVDSLVGLLRHLGVLLNTRGGVKEKDWSRIVGLLRQDEIKVRPLLESGFMHHTKLELVGLPGISSGTANKRRALVCRPLVFVAAPLSASATLYVISVDTTGSVICLALVRISHDAFSMDQLLTIVNPELIPVSVEHKGQRYELPLIRCDSGSETMLLVDGVPVQQD